MAIPLSAIGSPTSGYLEVSAFINGAGHDFLSNQVLAGIDGGDNLGEPRLVNFGDIPGDQYFLVPVPKPSSLGMLLLRLGAWAFRKRRG